MSRSIHRETVSAIAVLLLVPAVCLAEDAPAPPKETGRPAETAGEARSPSFASLRFDPATARTGGHAKLIAAGSDLCGIASLAGELRDPAGRLLQHFRSELDEAPCSGFDVPVEIAPGTQPGKWSLHNVTAEVHSGQELEVPAAVLKEATLDVSDGTPPLLVAVEVSQQHAEPGQTLRLRLTVTDYDGSGIARASGAFTDSAKGSGVTISGQPDRSGSLSVRVTLPKNAPSGRWMVASLTLEDKAGNVASYSQGDPVLQEAVVEVKRTEPEPVEPAVDKVSVGRVTINPATVAQGSKVTVRIEFDRSQTKIKRVNATFRDEQRISRRRLLFRRRIDDFTFETALRMSRAAPKGMWYLDEIRVTDDGGEEHTIRSGDSYALSDARFEVVDREGEGQARPGRDKP